MDTTVYVGLALRVTTRREGHGHVHERDRAKADDGNEPATDRVDHESFGRRNV